MSAMVERIAIALWLADVGPPADAADWPDIAPWQRDAYRASAEVALTELEEPTAEMWAAVNLVERDGAGRGRINNLCSAEGWRAMLAAARLAE